MNFLMLFEPANIILYFELVTVLFEKKQNK